MFKFLRWLRVSLVAMAVGSTLTLQILILQSLVRLERSLPTERPGCTLNNPCTVDLTGGAAEAIGRAMMKYR
jgi:hypothetical protein